MPLRTSKPASRIAAALAILMILIVIAAGRAEGGELDARQGTLRFMVFFSNDRLTADPADCTAVFPTKRTVPETTAVATAALNSLFSGPTPEEKDAGYRSLFSGATAGLLKHIQIKSGTAYVDLHDLRSTLSAATSSCGAAEFQSQIFRTLRQFPSIKRVRFAIEGNPRIFHEWMNETCGKANDYCNPKPFRRR